MSEPTRDEIIEGIAKGFKSFLEDRQFSQWSEKPLTMMKVALKEELDAFMRVNKDEIIKAIAEAAKEK